MPRRGKGVKVEECPCGAGSLRWSNVMERGAPRRGSGVRRKGPQTGQCGEVGECLGGEVIEEVVQGGVGKEVGSE